MPSRDVATELAAVGRSLTGDVRVVVVRSEGADFLDLPGLVDADWLGRPDLVSVAAVHGRAAGAGFALALSCDLRLAAEDAQLCPTALSNQAASPPPGPSLSGTAALVDLVGRSRALELMLTARRLGAREAEALGLVNLVVPRAELSGAVEDLVAALLAVPRPVATEVKALVAGAGSRTPAQQCEAERQARGRLDDER
ncbi:MAG: enoyl-CoA hydratase/isomerase family protein [Actinomycetota bacterium]|nr:enoyl-CoA hydratase/isomerase family protein [Actinomycetota bacterium]